MFSGWYQVPGSCWIRLPGSFESRVAAARFAAAVLPSRAVAFRVMARREFAPPAFPVMG